MGWVTSHTEGVIFIVILTILGVVNVAGNALVILVVRRFTFMQTPMNYLLVHLAICDILLAIFLLLFRFLNGVYEHSVGAGGDLLCKLITTGTPAWLAACSSIYTLVAIAWERYVAIMKPHSPRFSSRKLKISIASCWLLAIIINIPQRISYVYDSKTKTCVHSIPWMEKLDSLVWLFLVGSIPLIIMFVLYGRIIFFLWRSNDNDRSVAQRSLLISRKRITKSGVTVTVFLMVCWMPNLLYYTITTHEGYRYGDSEEPSIVFWRHATLVLLLLNSTLNPFIYELPDRRFRRCLKDLFKCSFKCKKTNRIHLEQICVEKPQDIAENLELDKFNRKENVQVKSGSDDA